jgi:hypothetical protein
VSTIISLPLVYFVLGSASNALFLFGLTSENSRHNMYKLVFAAIGIAFYIWAIKN